MTCSTSLTSVDKTKLKTFRSISDTERGRHVTCLQFSLTVRIIRVSALSMTERGRRHQKIYKITTINQCPKESQKESNTRETVAWPMSLISIDRTNLKSIRSKNDKKGRRKDLRLQLPLIERKTRLFVLSMTESGRRHQKSSEITNINLCPNESENESNTKVTVTGSTSLTAVDRTKLKSFRSINDTERERHESCFQWANEWLEYRLRNKSIWFIHDREGKEVWNKGWKNGTQDIW